MNPRLEGYRWMRHPSRILHDDAWFALPLFAVSGAMKKMKAKEGEFRPPPTLLETQAFKQVIDFFRCPLKGGPAGAWYHEHLDTWPAHDGARPPTASGICWPIAIRMAMRKTFSLDRIPGALARSAREAEKKGMSQG